MSELAKTEKKKPQTILDMIQSPAMQDQWKKVLPSILTPERLGRIVVTQIRKVPKLQQCDQASLLSSIMTCAELGIEPNGRHAHLIPYGNTCTLIIDYKGLVELAMRSGKISRLHADIVCENDKITIINGVIQHEINVLKERGEIVGAYAVCDFKDGATKSEYMSNVEINAIRDRSRACKSGPWITDWAEMAKKTAFRRMSKWLPLSPEVYEAFEKDYDSAPEIKQAVEITEEVLFDEPVIEDGVKDAEVADAVVETVED